MSQRKRRAWRHLERATQCLTAAQDRYVEALRVYQVERALMASLCGPRIDPDDWVSAQTRDEVARSGLAYAAAERTQKQAEVDWRASR